MYRVHNVKIRREDVEKAEKILTRHDEVGNIHHINVEVRPDAISYWIAPYIYEDFEAIRDEFIEAGIQII
jgi:hypothetical protein